MDARKIAVKLGLAEHTVSNYLFRIYNKLGISTRVELVLYALAKNRPEIPPRIEILDAAVSGVLAHLGKFGTGGTLHPF